MSCSPSQSQRIPWGDLGDSITETVNELQAAEPLKILHEMMRRCPLRGACRGTKPCELRYGVCHIEANPRGRKLKLGHKRAVELLSDVLGMAWQPSGRTRSTSELRCMHPNAWNCEHPSVVRISETMVSPLGYACTWHYAHCICTCCCCFKPESPPEPRLSHYRVSQSIYQVDCWFHKSILPLLIRSAESTRCSSWFNKIDDLLQFVFAWIISHEYNQLIFLTHADQQCHHTTSLFLSTSHPWFSFSRYI